MKHGTGHGKMGGKSQPGHRGGIRQHKVLAGATKSGRGSGHKGGGMKKVGRSHKMKGPARY